MSGSEVDDLCAEVLRLREGVKLRKLRERGLRFSDFFGEHIREAVAIIRDWFWEKSSAPKTPTVADSIPVPSRPVAYREPPERWCGHPELVGYSIAPARMVGFCEHNMSCPVRGFGWGCAPDPCNNASMGPRPRGLGNSDGGALRTHVSVMA